MNSKTVNTHQVNSYKNRHQLQNSPHCHPIYNKCSLESPCCCHFQCDYKSCCTCCQCSLCDLPKYPPTRVPIQLANAVKSSIQENKELQSKIQRLTEITLSLQKQRLAATKLDNNGGSHVTSSLNGKYKDQSTQSHVKDNLQTPIKHRKHLQLIPIITPMPKNGQIFNEYYGEFLKPKKLSKKGNIKKSNKSLDNCKKSMKSFKSVNQVYKDSPHRNIKHQKQHLISTIKLNTKLRQEFIRKIKNNLNKSF